MGLWLTRAASSLDSQTILLYGYAMLSRPGGVRCSGWAMHSDLPLLLAVTFYVFDTDGTLAVIRSYPAQFVL